MWGGGNRGRGVWQLSNSCHLGFYGGSKKNGRRKLGKAVDRVIAVSSVYQAEESLSIYYPVLISSLFLSHPPPTTHTHTHILLTLLLFHTLLSVGNKFCQNTWKPRNFWRRISSFFFLRFLSIFCCVVSAKKTYLRWKRVWGKKKPKLSTFPFLLSSLSSSQTSELLQRKSNIIRKEDIFSFVWTSGTFNQPPGKP